MNTSRRIKVLIVDDSALVRSILTEIFNSDPRLEVVGTAADAFIARDKIKKLNPDVLTLDIEMPKMDGISFLRNIMRLRPMPVVMISSLTEKGAPATLEALELGAFDYVSKPKEGIQGLEQYSKDIIEKLLAAANSRVKPLEKLYVDANRKRVVAWQDLVPRPSYVIAIGASTGGTEAIKELLCCLPENCPPIVVTQHIPAAFSASYAKRLDGVCPMRAYQAQQGQLLLKGCVYLAPGDKHLRVARNAKRELVCQLGDDGPINRHKPSVEALYDSVTATLGKNSVAALLTGMGEDGAAALLRMRQAGASTVVQNEATSVIWGMPGCAYNMGAAELALPLDKIAEFIIKNSFLQNVPSNTRQNGS